MSGNNDAEEFRLFNALGQLDPARARRLAPDRQIAVQKKEPPASSRGLLLKQQDSA
jgi:hypothetical protein